MPADVSAVPGATRINGNRRGHGRKHPDKGQGEESQDLGIKGHFCLSIIIPGCLSVSFGPTSVFSSAVVRHPFLRATGIHRAQLSALLLRQIPGNPLGLIDGKKSSRKGP
jgi:hypothetical protein